VRQKRNPTGYSQFQSHDFSFMLNSDLEKTALADSHWYIFFSYVLVHIPFLSFSVAEINDHVDVETPLTLI
ncbi:hypothetical protein AKJ16_DCAP03675, partial [Drosera capensis]